MCVAHTTFIDFCSTFINYEYFNQWINHACSTCCFNHLRVQRAALLTFKLCAHRLFISWVDRAVVCSAFDFPQSPPSPPPRFFEHIPCSCYCSVECSAVVCCHAVASISIMNSIVIQSISLQEYHHHVAIWDEVLFIPGKYYIIIRSYQISSN